jgi:hypothetical protein
MVISELVVSSSKQQATGREREVEDEDILVQYMQNTYFSGTTKITNK